MEKFDIKSLMIGDWVYNILNQKYEKVEEICCDSVMLNDEEYYESNEIEPILLTPEILEKNFGQKRAKGGVFYHSIGSHESLHGNLYYNIEYYNDCFGFCRDHGGLLCELKYVHELQLALRLCKIEKEIEL